MINCTDWPISWPPRIAREPEFQDRKHWKEDAIVTVRDVTGIVLIGGGATMCGTGLTEYGLP
jgi:hypothetical protein